MALVRHLRWGYPPLQLIYGPKNSKNQPKIGQKYDNFEPFQGPLGLTGPENDSKSTKTPQIWSLYAPQESENPNTLARIHLGQF